VGIQATKRWLNITVGYKCIANSVLVHVIIKFVIRCDTVRPSINDPDPSQNGLMMVKLYSPQALVLYSHFLNKGLNVG